ncbi:MAG: hypothetical protein KGZ73_09005 [Rhizobiales bacterium]|nr:hypothetical protein [Hyphomicrobiales bacterium]
MNSGIPNVSLVDAEIVFLDQGGETISLILSGKKRDFMWALSGDVAVKVGGDEPATNAERKELVEGQKRSIEQTIQKLQNLHARLSA